MDECGPESAPEAAIAQVPTTFTPCASANGSRTGIDFENITQLVSSVFNCTAVILLDNQPQRWIAAGPQSEALHGQRARVAQVVETAAAGQASYRIAAVAATGYSVKMCWKRLLSRWYCLHLGCPAAS